MPINKQAARALMLRFAAATILSGGVYMGAGALYTNDQEALEQRVDEYKAQAKDILQKKAGVDSSKVLPRLLRLQEAELARAVFGRGFDTRELSIDVSPERAKNGRSMMVMNEAPNRIYVFGLGNGSQNFALDSYDLPRFMNQLTHVWHARNGIKLDDTSPSIMPVELTADKKFMNYAPNERATIMQDYAQMFLVGQQNNARAVVKLPGFAKNMKTFNPDTPGDTERLAAYKQLLASTVEAQFPDAKNYRLALEERSRVNAATKAHYDAIKAEKAAQQPVSAGPKPIM